MSRAITSQSANHKVVQRYIEILNSGDPEELGEVLDPEYVQVIPQSGEVLRGVENFAQVMRNWPAGEAFEGHPRAIKSQIVSSESHDLITPGFTMFPTFNVVRIEGEGDTLTSYSRVKYSDGSEWYAVSIATLRDAKIVKEIFFFAPIFEAPEWRTPWVTAMSPDDERDLLGFVSS